MAVPVPSGGETHQNCIGTDIAEKIAKEDNHKIFVVDAALIYESGADTHMDYVIVVTSLLRYRTERVISKGQISREDFMKRVDLQWSDDDKDIIFKQCISWGLSAGKMNIKEANDYCYCSLEIIIENFKNRDDVIEQMEIDSSQSDLWIGCKN